MRVRITFSKTGTLKYIGHLDLNTVWERAARRAGLPLAYSQGYHPQPKMTFASALPLGYSSRCEMMDLRLTQDANLTLLSTQLQKALPSGIDILKLENVDEHEPALQTQVVSAEYEVILMEPVDESSLKRKIYEIMASRSLPRQRRGKSYDLRPLIEELTLRPHVPSVMNGEILAGHLPQSQGKWTKSEGGIKIFMRLSTRESATGRPDAVLSDLGISIESARIERTALILRDTNSL
jgi:radical SAM-linked protein